ncbi:MAG: hypothetical protein ACM3YE_16385 [Bacteroidota bacterium]
MDVFNSSNMVLLSEELKITDQLTVHGSAVGKANTAARLTTVANTGLSLRGH